MDVVILVYIYLCRKGGVETKFEKIYLIIEIKQNSWFTHIFTVALDKLFTLG